VVSRVQTGVDALLQLDASIDDPALADPMVPTGFTAVDAMLGGMPHRMGLVLGPPGSGKSSLLVDLACHVAKAGGVVHTASLEMDCAELARRRVARECGVPAYRLKQAHRLSLEDRGVVRNTLTRVGEWARQCIDADTPGVTAAHIVTEAARTKERLGRIDLLVVDHFHLLDYQQRKGERTDTAMTRASGILRDAARELECPVVVGAQLNRERKGRSGWGAMPRMTDIRECGALEQDAYWILGLLRADVETLRVEVGKEAFGVHGPATMPDGENGGPVFAAAGICKAREARTGVAPLTWKGAHMSFGEWAP